MAKRVTGAPPPVPGGRTEEERKAARRDRETRRAARVASRQGATGAGTDGRRADPRLGERAARGRERPAKEPAPRARRGRAPRPAPSPQARRAALIGLALVGVVMVWFLGSLFQPFKGDGEGRVRVVIPSGAGVADIADLLDRRDVVSNGFFFELRATIAGRRGELKPGTYTLRRDMSYGAVLDALSEGPPRDLVTVTLPEGRSRREVAHILRNEELEGSYVRSTRRSRDLDPGGYGGSSARDLEGFLFPATYELKRGSSVEALVARQLGEFKRQFARVDLGAARRANLTAYEVLIIASLVEREAAIDRERPLVASVIYNRLRQGTPLGIDATVRFVTGNWERPLTQGELAVDSPYNTRNRAGLPPGPIGNPGLESLRAAAKPARTDFLFYVIKPGTCNEHAFSRTLEEFERDRTRYNDARERRGGRSPTTCP